MRSLFKGELSIKDGNVKVGRTLANKPNFFTHQYKPCSGLTGARSLSYFDVHSSNKTASASYKFHAFHQDIPTTSMAQAPVVQASK
jgi:hypothetical protein